MRPRRARQQIKDGPQPSLDFGQAFARMTADQLVDDRHVSRDRRRVFLELPPRAGECQAFDEQQVLDANDLLDVRTAIDARPPAAFDTPRAGNSASHERST